MILRNTGEVKSKTPKSGVFGYLGLTCILEICREVPKCAEIVTYMVTSLTLRSCSKENTLTRYGFCSLNFLDRIRGLVSKYDRSSGEMAL